MGSFKAFQSRLVDSFNRECELFNHCNSLELERLHERVKEIERLETENAELRLHLQHYSNSLPNVSNKTSEHFLASGDGLFEKPGCWAPDKLNAISASSQQVLKQNPDLQRFLDAQAREYTKLQQAHEVVLCKLRESQNVIRHLQKCDSDNPKSRAGILRTEGLESNSEDSRPSQNAALQGGEGRILSIEKVDLDRTKPYFGCYGQEKQGSRLIIDSSSSCGLQALTHLTHNVSTRKASNGHIDHESQGISGRPSELDPSPSNPEFLYERPVKRRRISKYGQQEMNSRAEALSDGPIAGFHVKTENQPTVAAQESLDLDAVNAPIASSNGRQGGDSTDLSRNNDNLSPSLNNQQETINHLETSTSSRDDQCDQVVQHDDRSLDRHKVHSIGFSGSSGVQTYGNLATASLDLESGRDSQSFIFSDRKVGLNPLTRGHEKFYNIPNIDEFKQAGSHQMLIPPPTTALSRRNSIRPVLQPKHPNRIITAANPIGTIIKLSDQDHTRQQVSEGDYMLSVKNCQRSHYDSLGVRETALSGRLTSNTRNPRWAHDQDPQEYLPRPSKPVYKLSDGAQRHIWSEDVEYVKRQSRLRKIAPQNLRLSDFRLNPIVNRGVDFAYNETIRRKDERQCLPNCTKEECCGGRFSKMLLIGGYAPLMGVKEVPNHDLDTLHVETNQTSNSAQHALLHQARTREFARKYGKHRNAHERAASPPGFWETEMPSTQDLNMDNTKAQELEQRKVECRQREAMIPGGQWLFRD